MHTHQLVVRGGTVMDGTGAEGRTADVAIDDGIITAVGIVDQKGAVELDADGALVTPGFVDIHAHYDGQATWDHRLVPSTWHGVTTLVAGNCGVGFAPVHETDHQRLIELMEGVEDIPGTALHEGLPWTWHSFPEFLDSLEGRAFDADLALQVPHAAVRRYVMGDRAAADSYATPEDIVLMGKIAAEGIEAGALGFSTSRTKNHRASTGEYTPTLTAGHDELVGIARAIGATGTGVLQLVSDFPDVEEEFGLLRKMAEASGRPLSFSLAQGFGDSWRRMLELLEQANADGLPITGQVAVRAVGILLGLQCTLNPLMTNPVMKELDGHSTSDKAAAMRDPSFREKVLSAAGEARARGKLGGSLIGAFDRMFELGDPPDYEPDAADSVGARARRDGIEPVELAYDLMAQAAGETFLYMPLLNYADGNLDAVGEMLAHPFTVPGLSDGGAHVGTICDASFPTTLLSYWGRDREKGRLPIPELVRQHTSATARTVGLLDRGVLAPGYRGDLNVIDLERLQARRPEMRSDLPAGGRRLVQKADGYVATVVAGEVVHREGEHTDALPGRLIRGAKPAPGGAA